MIECIPNFSTSDLEVLAALTQAIEQVDGVQVLDTHVDSDHNRSVITCVGDTTSIGEAAFCVVAEAAKQIDMQAHCGQHPRIGATDVLPFVPFGAATMEQCVALARAVGQRIGEELAIPVFFYGAAATTPERYELPNVRQGEYEGLRDTIAHDPARSPDYGPAQLGSAGATAVGARMPLIAYNIYLTTSDVRIARRIAKAVRGSSGGLRGVRALGLLVDGRAQVSMNLTDYKTTPLHRVVDMVVREAAAYGVMISESELVGLIPEDALIDAACFYLHLHTMDTQQILERRISTQGP